ncbi:MAG: hypothetical protein ABRQ24_06685 [Syntrophomonadaceae bacterium]
MEVIKYRLMIVMGYLGAVIGAGFASGQEIVQFFVHYGHYGIYATAVAALMFAACGSRLLYLAHAQRASNYQDILNHLLGERLGWLVDILVAVFLFLGISTMLSASGAVFYEHLYLPKTLGIFIAYLVVVILLITGKKGLIYSYNLLVPVKLILMMLISGYAAFYINPGPHDARVLAAYHNENWNWLISAILYVSYNFSLAMVVLTQYQGITTRRNGILGAAWGGLALGGMVLINYLAMCKFLPEVTYYQVPMLFVAGQVSQTAKHLYTIVLWLGIITTALANAYGFTQRFAQFTGLSYPACLILCLTLAIPLSLQSFSMLVATIYPVFGLIGVSIMIALIYKTTKDMGREVYYRIIRSLHSVREA